MIDIRMAELNIRIDNKYPYLERLCADYLTEGVKDFDVVVSATEEEIDSELNNNVGVKATRGYAEGICIYRNICRQLPHKFDAFLFHSAVIEYEGRGYAFAARSGTGKTTHISLWQKRFGSKVRIINGDKPIFRFDENGTLFAYGTPWCGKEGFHINAKVPLGAICFIERGDENKIERIGADRVLGRVFDQILMPQELESVDSLFPLLDRTIKEIPCYLLKCNVSEEAAEVAYNGMKNGGVQ